MRTTCSNMFSLPLKTCEHSQLLLGAARFTYRDVPVHLPEGWDQAVSPQGTSQLLS